MNCKLKEVRETQRMTAEKLAQLSGVSRVTIWKIENNKLTDIKTGTLLKLSKALGVKFEDLFMP